MKARTYLPLVLSLALALPAAAQDYEDDIYFNPDKPRKAATTKTTTKAGSNAAYITGAAAATPAVADYPAADTYTPAAGSGLNMSVDEYNRRGAYATGTPADSTAAEADAFAYTRRIERFHNPDIVAESDDDEFVEYYYATDPVVLNVNVIDVNPWDWWGPSWGWGGPGWGGPHGPQMAWRPSGPGSFGTHRPATGSGIASTHRPGSTGSHSTAGVRPGSSGNHATAGTGLRPGSSLRPGSTVRPGSGTTTIGRGRYGSGQATAISGNRTPLRPSAGSSATTRRPGSVVATPSTGTTTHRGSGTAVSGASSTSSRRTTGSSSQAVSTSRSSSSSSSHRSSGSSFGSSSRSSGGFSSGGGGSHGGGGGRGRR